MSGVWSLNHCTTSMSLSFHFLDNTLWGTFLIFMRSSLSIFLLMLLIHLVLCLRSHCLYKVMKTYTHVFFWAFSAFSSLMYFWVNFCIWYEVGGSNLILLYVDFQLSQHHLWKTLLFPPLNYRGTFVENSWLWTQGFVSRLSKLSRMFPWWPRW